MIERPQQNEHPQYFGQYIALAEQGDALQLLEQNQRVVVKVFSSLSEEKQNFRYAVGKWTPKQVLSHITDTERGMCYRAMCIARGDTQNLPYMDEDLFAQNADAQQRTMASLVDEYSSVRGATLTLFRDSIPAERLSIVGTVNSNPMSARALAWIIAGHEIHHVSILQERYLQGEAVS